MNAVYKSFFIVFLKKITLEIPLKKRLWGYFLSFFIFLFFFTGTFSVLENNSFHLSVLMLILNSIFMFFHISLYMQQDIEQKSQMDWIHSLPLSSLQKSFLLLGCQINLMAFNIISFFALFSSLLMVSPFWALPFFFLGISSFAFFIGLSFLHLAFFAFLYHLRWFSKWLKIFIPLLQILPLFSIFLLKSKFISNPYAQELFKIENLLISNSSFFKGNIFLGLLLFLFISFLTLFLGSSLFSQKIYLLNIENRSIISRSQKSRPLFAFKGIFYQLFLLEIKSLTRIRSLQHFIMIFLIVPLLAFFMNQEKNPLFLFCFINALYLSSFISLGYWKSFSQFFTFIPSLPLSLRSFLSFKIFFITSLNSCFLILCYTLATFLTSSKIEYSILPFLFLSFFSSVFLITSFQSWLVRKLWLHQFLIPLHFFKKLIGNVLAALMVLFSLLPFNESYGLFLKFNLLLFFITFLSTFLLGFLFLYKFQKHIEESITQNFF